MRPKQSRSKQPLCLNSRASGPPFSIIDKLPVRSCVDTLWSLPLLVSSRHFPNHLCSVNERTREGASEMLVTSVLRHGRSIPFEATSRPLRTAQTLQVLRRSALVAPESLFVTVVVTYLSFGSHVRDTSPCWSPVLDSRCCRVWPGALAKRTKHQLEDLTFLMIPY